MGVIIGTASKVVDKFGAGLHGFTSGVPESGVPATQFSSDWADGVQQEINNVITAGDEESPDNSDRDQLSKSIDYQNRVTYPRSGSTATYYWRGHVTAGPGASYQNHRESGFKHNVADNTVQSMIGLAIPTNSQAQVILRGSLVRSNSMTVYGNCAFSASVRNSAGTYTLQNTATIHSDQNLVGLVMVPIASGGIYLRFTIPVSVGALFNIFATIDANVVVWG